MAWIHVKDRLHYGWFVFVNEMRRLPARLWPPRYRPMLDVLLDVGFFSIRTVAMRRSDYSRVYDYIGLECNVLKWSFRFRLYDTMERKYDR